MRVLFLESHPMWIHGLPNGFRDAGHKVKISGPLTRTNIPKLIAGFRPHLIVTLGWTFEHKKNKRAWIREAVKKSGIPHIYWATEDPTHTESFTLPYLRGTRPDFVFTICRSRVADYRKLGIRAAHLDFGYHPKVHRRVPVVGKYRCNIGVVANAYPQVLRRFPNHFRKQSLQQLLRPLVRGNVRVDLWGRNWEGMKEHFGKGVPKKWIHGYLDYTQANKVYSSAKIIIALQNQLTQVTQRTYEILGSGGFVLTNNTPEIRRLFKHKKHLLLSKSPAETLQLVDYYLNHPVERERIRKAGQAAARKHSYEQRARRIVRVLRQHRILR